MTGLDPRHAGRVIVTVDGAVTNNAHSPTEELVHRVFGVPAILAGQGDSRVVNLLSPNAFTSEKSSPVDKNDA